MSKAEYARLYYLENKAKILSKKAENAERDRASQKAWVEANKDRVKEYQQQYYGDNKVEITARHEKNRQANRDHIRVRQNAYMKKRKDEDPLFKLSYNLRVLIGQSIKKGGYSKKAKTSTILGCSWEQMKSHLEERFTEGMTWDNMGEWHLDHIVPVYSAKTEIELLNINHYTNFQPLWAVDNIRKGNRLSYS